ncbi:plasmid mobilization relaxosome protein MobC [Pyramidobacter porci]
MMRILSTSICIWNNRRRCHEHAENRDDLSSCHTGRTITHRIKDEGTGDPQYECLYPQDVPGRPVHSSGSERYPEFTKQISRIGNNLNQYARQANATGSIYEQNIQYLRKQFAVLYDTEEKILIKLSRKIR